MTLATNAPIVVLGAGPAGMAAAWRLSELGRRVTVLEKDGAVGGMGKTITVGVFASSKEHALTGIWWDIVQTAANAPCFASRIVDITHLLS